MIRPHFFVLFGILSALAWAEDLDLPTQRLADLLGNNYESGLTKWMDILSHFANFLNTVNYLKQYHAVLCLKTKNPDMIKDYVNAYCFKDNCQSETDKIRLVYMLNSKDEYRKSVFDCVKTQTNLLLKVFQYADKEKMKLQLEECENEFDGKLQSEEAENMKNHTQIAAAKKAA